jgi:signal recognition particle subunit SRP54
MAELEDIKNAIMPQEVLLVVDAMTGQEAVNVAEVFHERIGLTGLVLTKMDGDARGGAALSITSVTGVPVKFIGTSERVDGLEQFHPDRLASRILGMGDVLTLVERAKATFEEDKIQQLEKKFLKATFDLEDFLDQMQAVKKMGPMNQMLEMIPGFSAIKGKVNTEGLDGSHLVKAEAIIQSMTKEERQRPELIGGNRRKRISRGSGTSPQDVNQLLNQFKQVRKMMKDMASPGGQKKLLNMMSQQKKGPFGF